MAPRYATEPAAESGGLRGSSTAPSSPRPRRGVRDCRPWTRATTRAPGGFARRSSADCTGHGRSAQRSRAFRRPSATTGSIGCSGSATSPSTARSSPTAASPYLPCAVDAVLRVVEHAPVRASDVFVDVGSGAGRTAALVHLLTGAPVVGIEIQRGLALTARDLAARLLAPRMSWWRAMRWSSRLHHHRLDLLPLLPLRWRARGRGVGRPRVHRAHQDDSRLLRRSAPAAVLLAHAGASARPRSLDLPKHAALTESAHGAARRRRASARARGRARVKPRSRCSRRRSAASGARS